MNVKRFVSSACSDLSRFWEMIPNSEDGFFWMSMMHAEGRVVTADFSALFNNVPDEMDPQRAREVISDAINIITFENKIKEAVICYNSIASGRPGNTYGLRTIVTFNYHGMLGQKTNSRPIKIIDNEMNVCQQPYLGKHEKPANDVDKWEHSPQNLFRDLVPHQKIKFNAVQYKELWYVTVCDLLPTTLPDMRPNGFSSRFEAIEQMKMIEESMQTSDVGEHILQKINQEIYQERKRRCPIKVGMNYDGSNKSWKW